jgi:putative ABC transport system permease protein
VKYFLLIWSGLWRKKARAILTLFSIVTAFILFGILQGINVGIDSLTDQFTDTTRLRVFNRTNPSEALPISHRDRIAVVNGVAQVTPLVALLGSYQHAGNQVIAVGVDVQSWYAAYPEFITHADGLAAMKRTRNGALIGAVLAKRFGWKVGDRIPLQSDAVLNVEGHGNWEFDVVGIYDIDGQTDFATNVLVNFDFINEARMIRRNTADQFVIGLVDPSQHAQIAAAIDELFANSASQTMTQNEREFIQSTINQVGDINFFFNGIVGAVLFTLLFLTANTMMQSVRERTPEIGVLKTLGYSNTKVMVFVLIESLMMSIIAALAGLLLAAAIFPALVQGLGPSAGLEGVRIPTSVFAWGMVVAVLLALFSGLPPALRAMRLNIVDAVAGR